MELIYVYIDKYRTFEKCEISFSKRFDVTYDHGAHQLSIQENPRYRSIYPQYISNINGIFGKNASGKTSLLSLIGKRIEDRHRAHEIFEEREKDAHRKIDLLSLEKTEGVESVRYSSSYFLIYSLGKDDDENPLFIFETNTPKVYVDIFENSECLTKDRGELGAAIDYYIGKGWFAGVFKNQQGKNIFLRNTQYYPEPRNCVQKNVSIIYFKSDVFLNKFQIPYSPYSFEEEHTICLKRRMASLQSIFLENQIKFLSKQMKRDGFQTAMYCDKTYTMGIKFQYNILSKYDFMIETGYEKIEIEDIVRDYRDFKISHLEEWQKITLAFLHGYVWYMICEFLRKNDLIEEKKALVKSLKGVKAQDDTYQDIKHYYYQKISIILKHSYSENLTLKKILDLEMAFEKFLRDAANYQIRYRYQEDNLMIELSKESDLESVDFFFKYVLDEDMHKILNMEESTIGSFFGVEIHWFSDGERENLALFTSIDEQISMYPKKKQYILLFDEIERSMHPDLCRRLVTELIEFLSQYPGKQFQIIIASHSPFIASDMLQENVVCLSRNGEKSEVKRMGDKPFAQNIHTILKSQFFLDSFLGEYACRCVNVMLKCFKCTSGEKIIPILNEFLMSEDSMDSAKRISSLGDAKGFIEFMKDAIGEPLIRNELSRLWKLSQNKWEAKK